eukprot:TRINITY_DN6810_c0_g1_i5.p1 TRINITY_DN6810_c0_g1~~TRINITY_DN6810_c0_g1_i5.p1  ORF type:complete len:236 (+),score=34.04 TRINITY_DN6810_c0_g1_i5:412-1119(+)
MTKSFRWLHPRSRKKMKKSLMLTFGKVSHTSVTSNSIRPSNVSNKRSRPPWRSESKDFTTAKTHLLTSREVLKNIGFGNIPVLVQILNNLLNSLEGLEQWEEADTYSGELCDTLDKLEGGKGGDLAMAYLRHALIKDKLKKDAESADCARKSNKILEGINNPAKDPYVLKNLLLISQSLASEKKFQEMLDITKNQALPLALKLYGKDDRASLFWVHYRVIQACLLYTSPSPRDQA